MLRSLKGAPSRLHQAFDGGCRRLLDGAMNDERKANAGDDNAGNVRARLSGWIKIALLNRALATLMTAGWIKYNAYEASPNVPATAE